MLMSVPGLRRAGRGAGHFPAKPWHAAFPVQHSRIDWIRRYVHANGSFRGTGRGSVRRAGAGAIACSRAITLGFKADVQADGVPTNIQPDATPSPPLRAMVRKARRRTARYRMGTWQNQAGRRDGIAADHGRSGAGQRRRLCPRDQGGPDSFEAPHARR